MGEAALPSSVEEVANLVLAAGRSAPRTAVLIRLRLLEGPASCYDLYQYVRAFHESVGLPPPSYERIRQMVFVLKRLNLIRVTGQVPASRPWLIPETMYELVPENVNSPMWRNPKAHYSRRPAPPAAPPAPPVPPPGRPPEERRRRGARRPEERVARLSWPASVEECAGYRPEDLVELVWRERVKLDGFRRLLALVREGCPAAEAAWQLARARLEADAGMQERLAEELVKEGVLAEGVEYDADFLMFLLETML